MTKEQTTSTCSAEGCKRPQRAKSYCSAHYKKWRQGELPGSRYKTCTAEGCRKKRHTKTSLCPEHFEAKYGKKEAEAAPAAAPAPAEAAPAQ